MFIAALLTGPKLWKQPKCPSTDDYIKTEILFGHEKEGNPVIVTT